ncbi:PorV/PorQ family protein [Porphyromonas sp.]|uniref:PorV/PorQ family protein n=1 Tax=Porphyromonas sp. TaxID=1924944 RepID=UPI0026DBFCCC|nr:PorV/PorQ family protein [Porphyromonas sp.]MDO4771666.1 PorV/PorQ family protein [Porphyromonas sp.]
MIKTFNRLFTIFALFSGVASVAAHAQDNNPILNFGTDVRSAGMGDVIFPHSGAPLLHSNPSLIFMQKDRDLHVGYSFGATHKGTTQGQIQTYHATSIGYRLGGRHALFGGARYWRGPKTIYLNNMGAKMGEVYPADATLDLGYTFKVCSHFSVYSSLTYLNTYSSRTGHAFAMSLGANYNAVLTGVKSGVYGVSISLSNIGTDITYPRDKGSRSQLPSLFGVSSAMTMGVLGDHLLTFGAAYGYRFLPSVARLHTVGGGIEYAMPDIVSLRVGGQYEPGNSHMTLGLGRKFGAFGIDLAYTMGMYPEFNLLRAGFTLSI